MREIRLCLKRRLPAGTKPLVSRWMADEPVTRSKLEEYVRTNNRKHGDDAHWIEERDAQAAALMDAPPQRLRPHAVRT